MLKRFLGFLGINVGVLTTGRKASDLVDQIRTPKVLLSRTMEEGTCMTGSQMLSRSVIINYSKGAQREMTRSSKYE